MTLLEGRFPTTRRRVLQLLALLGVGGSHLGRTTTALANTLAHSGDLRQKEKPHRP